MVEIGLTDDNLPNLCRLCLQVDDFIVDIFHRLDPNPFKQPLPERIYELYQVKVGKADGLPTNICHRCLYFTESFTEFRNNVRKCEAKLQSYVASIGILGSVKSPINGIKTEDNDGETEGIEDYSCLLPDENSLVTVVDPNQDYDSSDDSFSMDSDTEFTPTVPQPIPSNNSANGTLDTPAPSTNFHYISTDNHENAENLKNVYLCQYCDMAFTAQIECAEHEARHDAANPHSCNYCPFRCSSRQVVIAHIKELHDNDRPYVCVQCNKGFGRRSDLKKHTIVHTGIRPFTCPVCNKNFSRNTNLTKHMRIHTGLKPHVCQKCPRSFTTTTDLIHHQRVHNDHKPFQCTKCPSAFTRKDKLHHHEKMHARKEQQSALVAASNTTTDSLATSNEGDAFDAENMVISLDPYIDVNHVENAEHGNDNVQPNPETESIKITIKQPPSNPEGQQQQTQHVTGDAGEGHNFDQELYSCDFCPKKFSLVSALVHHHNVHKVERSHVCPVCSKAFLRKRELQRHSVIHTGIKPFACRVCHKRFNRKDKVVRHERIHAEEKYPCNQCQLGFSKQEALDMHVKVHELAKTTPEPLSMSVADVPQSHNLLQDGFRPQLNFYSELRPEQVED